MKRLLLIVIAVFSAVVSLNAQSGFQIDSLFNGGLASNDVKKSVVVGKSLKPCNLDSFKSIRFLASDQDIDKVSGWVSADSPKSLGKEMEYQDGRLVYALLRYAGSSSTDNKYVCYQIKTVDGNNYVTVVYMTGPATLEDLRVIFKHR